MTIDDELLLELFKPDKYGKVGKDALIVNVVKTLKLEYTLEESTSYWEYYERRTELESGREQVKITPDIIVKKLDEKYSRPIAIELENDIQWDFQESVKQVKKYKNKFEDVRVIIPEKYKLFAPLYKNEEFRVYLWKAKRKWQCLRCGTINVNESRVPPKCEGKYSEGRPCDNRSRDEFDLVGLEDADVYEYE